MTLKKKIIVQSVVAVLAVLVLVGLGYRSISTIQTSLNQASNDELKPLIDEDVATIIAFQDAIATILNADRDAYQTLEAEMVALNSNDAKTIEGALGSHQENLQQVIDRMGQAAAVMSDVVAEEYGQFEMALADWAEATNHTMQLAVDPDQHEQAIAYGAAHSRPAFDAMREMIDTITELGEAEIAARTEQSEQRAANTFAAFDGIIQAGNQMLVMFGGVSLAAAVICVLLGAYLIRSISRALKTMIDTLQDIAQGEGDLTRRVDQDRKDELGELGKWFNTFVQKIHDIISEVAGASSEVASAATEIAASSEQVASSTGEQTSQVNQISAAVEEMSASIVEVAKKSSDAADNATQSGQVASDGGEVVRKTVDGIQAIAESTGATSEALETLGKQSEQIGQLVDVINDIADQTNLLALNAAIEAARAGEAGRGFAVVADEVRKLADRTTTATSEVAQSVQAIQQGTKQASEHMGQGSQRVQEGVEYANQAGESLATIVTNVQGVADMIRSIAAAAEEQSAASEQVSHNTESITAVIRESTQGAQQSATAAAQLSTKAEQLQLLVGQFKLDEKRAA